MIIGNDNRFSKGWRGPERRAKMTSKTTLNGLNPQIFLVCVVPKRCPKKVVSRGFKLVPAAAEGF